MARNEWRWNPTDSQRELFNEWKKYAVGYLVSSREGTNIRSIPGCLEEHTGEDIPLEKMGFRTINQFLYEMNDCLEVRTLNGKLFVFIREGAVPSGLMNIRQLVLGQAKDKGCKTKTGVIKRPTKNQSSYVRAEELLEAVKHIINRPNYTNTRPVVAPVGLPPTQRSNMSSNFASRSSSHGGSFQQRPNSINPRNYNSPSYSNPRVSRSVPMSSQNSRNTNTYGTNRIQKPIEKVLRDPRGSGSGYNNNSIYGSSSQPQSYQSAGRPPVVPSSSKSSMASGYSNGKENLPSTDIRKSANLSQDGWDDWTGSMSKPASTLNTSTTTWNSVTSKSSAPAHRAPRLPDGLILTDGSDSESEDFDYYCGATKTSKTGREKYSNIKVTIPNPSRSATTASDTSSSSTSSTVVTQVPKTVAPRLSSVTNASTVARPQSAASSSLLKNSGTNPGTSSQTTFTKPALPPISSFGFGSPVAASVSKPTELSSLPKPTATETMPSPAAAMLLPKSEASTAMQKPAETLHSRPTSSSVKPTSIVSVSNSLTQSSAKIVPPPQCELPTQKSARPNENNVTPNAGVKLGIGAGMDAPLAHSLHKEPAIRMAFNLPKITFPPYFRGGSLKANLSLKAYLSGYSN